MRSLTVVHRELVKLNHISKMVLSTVKFGGPGRTELRTFRWDVQI